MLAFRFRFVWLALALSAMPGWSQTFRIPLPFPPQPPSGDTQGPPAPQAAIPETASKGLQPACCAPSPCSPIANNKSYKIYNLSDMGLLGENNTLAQSIANGLGNIAQEGFPPVLLENKVLVVRLTPEGIAEVDDLLEKLQIAFGQPASPASGPKKPPSPPPVPAPSFISPETPGEQSPVFKIYNLSDLGLKSDEAKIGQWLAESGLVAACPVDVAPVYLPNNRLLLVYQTPEVIAKVDEFLKKLKSTLGEVDETPPTPNKCPPSGSNRTEPTPDPVAANSASTITGRGAGQGDCNVQTTVQWRPATGLLANLPTALADGPHTYGGQQSWWNKPKLTPEEERLQRFWHDYYDAMKRYYGTLDRIDWVAYYKNHGYQINTGDGAGCYSGGTAGVPNQANIQFEPVFVSPSMQWMVPDRNLNGALNGAQPAAPVCLKTAEAVAEVAAPSPSSSGRPNSGTDDGEIVKVYKLSDLGLTSKDDKLVKWILDILPPLEGDDRKIAPLYLPEKGLLIVFNTPEVIAEVDGFFKKLKAALAAAEIGQETVVPPPLPGQPFAPPPPADERSDDATATSANLKVSISGPPTAILGRPFLFDVIVDNPGCRPLDNVLVTATFTSGLEQASKPGHGVLALEIIALPGQQRRIEPLQLIARQAGLQTVKITATARGVSREAQISVMVLETKPTFDSSSGSAQSNRSKNHDPRIRTVYVPMCKNLTKMHGSMELEFDLTRAIIREIQSRTPYRVVHERDGADSELLCTLKQRSKTVININQIGETREPQLSVFVEVVWRDLRTGQQILSESTLPLSFTIPDAPGSSVAQWDQVWRKLAPEVVKRMSDLETEDSSENADSAPIGYSRSGRFNIPFTLPLNQDCRELRLFVSTDEGQTFSLTEVAKPDAGKFRFEAEQDGMFWFRVQTVSCDGMTSPEELSSACTAIKVVVDKTPPVVTLTALPTKGNSIGVCWDIREDNPDLDLAESTILEYRQIGTENWQNLTMAPIACEHYWNATEVVEVRLRVRDRAGNWGEGSITVNPDE